MSSFKVILVGALCVYFLKVENATSNPTELSGKHQRGIENDWVSVLSSIESRLKNLDNLYTSQLTPTLETRLGHFQNRISGMEMKLLRIEALLTNKLDRMSDNISSRHFRDDMVQTDLFRKIETAYDGITHRLAYMDRKFENTLVKLQGKDEVISKKLENMDDTLTEKYDSIESELSECTAGMDDLKSMLNISERNLLISLDRHIKVSSIKLDEMRVLSRKNFSLVLSDTVSRIQENTTKSFDALRRKVNTQITMSNMTGKSMQLFSEDLGKMFNEYASKVSDLGAQVLKSDNKIATHLRTIETVANFTRAELQNGLRSLMVQIGKVFQKENTQYEVVDQRVLSDMSQKMENNFEKIITTQNSFLESCYRVQMDESQIETQISAILNKLIDNFSEMSKEQHYLLKKIEGLLVKHDIHFKKDLYQANTNILAIFDQSKKNFKILNEGMKKSAENLEALFSLLQNVLGHSNINWKREVSNEKGLREYIENLERALNLTKLEQIEMFDSYRATIETLMTLTQSRNNDQKSVDFLIKNMSSNIVDVKEGIHKLSLNLNSSGTSDILNLVKSIDMLVKENNKSLVQILNSYKNKTTIQSKPQGRSQKSGGQNKNTITENRRNTSDIDELIRKVFFSNVTTTTEKTQTSCLDFDIDVRFEGSKRYEKCGNQSKKEETTEIVVLNSKTNDSDCSDVDMNVYINEDGNSRISKKCRTADETHNKTTAHDESTEKNSMEQSTTLDTNCLDFPIDVRFDRPGSSSNGIKLCKNVTNKINLSEHQIPKEQQGALSQSNQSFQHNEPIVEIKNSTEFLDLSDLIN